MADISKIKLPDGNTYNIKDTVSGYTTNTGTVTSVTIKGTSPIVSSSSSAITTSGTRTISHANSGVTPGDYTKVTVNATGHVTDGSNPTTLSGYGITDAKIESGTITLGSDTITPLTSHQTVTDGNPTLDWSTQSTVATIGSTDIHVTMPSNPNTDKSVTAVATDPTSTTGYYPIMVTGATNQQPKYSSKSAFKFNITNGTASDNGWSSICIGNNIASGTANNMKGYLTLYSAGTYRTNLSTNTITANTDVYLPTTSGTLALTSQIPTITDTYSGTSSDGMSGKAVKSAIDALDGGTIGTPSASKTLTALSQTNGNISATFADIAIANTQVSGLGTASVKNVPASGNASSTEVVMGNDTRLTDSRTPTSHSHGNITNAGVLSSDITIANGDQLVVTDKDSSTAYQIARSPIKFDASTTTKALTPKGTWETFSKLTLGTTSSDAYRGDYGNTAYTHATDSNRLTTATSSGLYKVASTAEGHIASLTDVEKADITALGIPASDTVPSAYCTTAAGTAAKTATCTDYALLSKSWIQVIIKTANTSKTALTLSINGKTAKPIYINGSASSTSNYTLPAGSYFVYYDGTNYYFRTDGILLAGQGRTTSSQYRKVLLSTQADDDYAATATTNTGICYASDAFSYKANGGILRVPNIITSGYISAAPPADNAHFPASGFIAQDVRNATDFFTTTAINFIMGGWITDHGWSSGIHFKPSGGAYSAWEIMGYANNSDGRTKPLYVRGSNKNVEWGDWRKIYDSSNPPTASEVGALASTTKYALSDSVGGDALNSAKVGGYTIGTTSVGSASTGTAITADDITSWTTNTPTAVTKKTVVTSATFNTVVTGGSKTSIPNISKKTVVTGVTKKTVVTSAGGATASYANGILTLTDGAFSTGDSCTVTTGDSVTVGTAIEAYTSLTTGESGSCTTGDSCTVTAGTAATLKYTARSIPNISVTSTTVATATSS